jgi:SepF-like predicted cell division protein (DUF552 family)
MGDIAILTARIHELESQKDALLKVLKECRTVVYSCGTGELREIVNQAIAQSEGE